MFHPDFDYGLGKERVVQMHTEVKHNRLESRLVKEARLAKVASLSEEARLAKARLAKARLGEQTVLHMGMLTRGTTFVAALFR